MADYHDVGSRVTENGKSAESARALPEEVPVYNIYQWLSDCREMKILTALAPLAGNIELRHAVDPCADLPVGKNNYLQRPQGNIIEDYLDCAGNILFAQML